MDSVQSLEIGVETQAFFQNPSRPESKQTRTALYVHLQNPGTWTHAKPWQARQPHVKQPPGLHPHHE